MERTKVVSSQIESVGYDPASKVLEIQFKSRRDGIEGPVYQYDGVPQEIADQLVAAQSVGRYFGAFIKGKFPFRKIEAPPEPKPDAPEPDEDIPF